MCVCEVGTVDKISDCQPEGPKFNPWPGRGFEELWATFFRHTIRGQGHKAVGLVSQCSIGGLKRTHTVG